MELGPFMTLVSSVDFVSGWLVGRWFGSPFASLALPCVWALSRWECQQNQLTWFVPVTGSWAVIWSILLR